MSNRKTNKNKSIPPKFAGGVETKGARKDKKKKNQNSSKVSKRYNNEGFGVLWEWDLFVTGAR